MKVLDISGRWPSVTQLYKHMNGWTDSEKFNWFKNIPINPGSQQRDHLKPMKVYFKQNTQFVKPILI